MSLIELILFFASITLWTISSNVCGQEETCTPGDVVWKGDAFCKILSPANGATVSGIVPIIIEYAGCAGEICECKWVGDDVSGYEWVCNWVPIELPITWVYCDLFGLKYIGDGMGGTFNFNWDTVEGCVKGVKTIGVMAGRSEPYCPTSFPFDSITLTVINSSPVATITSPVSGSVSNLVQFQLLLSFTMWSPTPAGLNGYI